MVPRQTVYQKSTQDRINFTSEVLGSMKAVKMLGFAERFASLIAAKRDYEIDTGKKFRIVSVYSNAISELCAESVLQSNEYSFFFFLGSKL